MNAIKQHGVAADMEDELSAIEARSDALLMLGRMIGEEHNERDGAAICQLAHDIYRDARRAEKMRVIVAGALHRLAYPVA